MTSIYSQNQRYKDVFGGVLIADSYSVPVLCADFNQIEFRLDIPHDGIVLPSGFNVYAYISNNDSSTPPDFSQPSSPTNQYDAVMYTDFAGGVNYDTDNPYNPTADTYPGVFKFFPQGATWCFLVVSGFSQGQLTQADISLFNN